MHHIDDLFLWLSHIISRRLNIDVCQFWAQRLNSSRNLSIELRTMSCRNPDLPQQAVLNTHLVEVIERLFKERNGAMPQPVEQAFSQRLAAVLAQHYLHYWGGYLLYNSARLPPLGQTVQSLDQAPPLFMIASFFTREPPTPRLLPTIGHVLEQAVMIAKKHGLLLVEGQQLSPSLHPAPTPVPPTAESSGAQGPRPTRGSPSVLLDLIPQRTQLSNSITNTTPISDRHAQGLYQLIDGRKTLAVISALSQMNKGEFYQALRSLLTLDYIQLYERNGRQVESSRILQVL
jgi:hypothetical protein